jgi:hypothetical protein
MLEQELDCALSRLASLSHASTMPHKSGSRNQNLPNLNPTFRKTMTPHFYRFAIPRALRLEWGN